MLNGTVGKVVVGKGAVTGNPADPIHPMDDEPDYIHYIQTIWVEDQESVFVLLLKWFCFSESFRTGIFQSFSHSD